jgi:hypothetical protein
MSVVKEMCEDKISLDLFINVTYLPPVVNAILD